MTTITETRHAGGHVVSEANGHLSREAIVIRSGETLQAGTVLGKITVGEAVAAAVAGNTANSGAMTMANPATGLGVKPGVYRVTCIEPASDAGTFLVEDPDGVKVGIAQVGVAFTGVVKFTIADGSGNFVAGDSFTITVADGTGQYGIYDPTLADGRGVVAGVLFDGVDAASAATAGVAHVRDCEVAEDGLTWFTGADASAKTVGKAGLTALGIRAR